MTRDIRFRLIRKSLLFIQIYLLLIITSTMNRYIGWIIQNQNGRYENVCNVTLFPLPILIMLGK